MHFDTKSYLKNNRNHTAKQTLTLSTFLPPPLPPFFFLIYFIFLLLIRYNVEIWDRHNHQTETFGYQIGCSMD